MEAPTRPPDAMVLALMDDEPETRPMCPARRWDKWGWLAHRCTWLEDHSGARHHDTHTGATWEDK